MNPVHPRPRSLPSTPATGRAACVAPRRAFTLVEILSVTVIIAVVSSIVVVRYAGALAQYRVAIAADKVAADLAWAKARARSTSTTRSVVFSAGDTPSYSVSGEVTHPGSTTPYSVRLDQSPYVCALTDPFNSDTSPEATLPTVFTTTIQFNSFGEPVAPGTIRVQSGPYTRTIQVSAGGDIHVTNP